MTNSERVSNCLKVTQPAGRSTSMVNKTKQASQNHAKIGCKHSLKEVVDTDGWKMVSVWVPGRLICTGGEEQGSDGESCWGLKTQSLRLWPLRGVMAILTFFLWNYFSKYLTKEAGIYLQDLEVLEKQGSSAIYLVTTLQVTSNNFLTNGQLWRFELVSQETAHSDWIWGRGVDVA